MNSFLVALLIAAPIGIIAATWAADGIGRWRFPLPPADRRIGCIDGMRGYLALAVMVSHFFIWSDIVRFGGAWVPPAINILNQLGAGGVALFFMTTGLVFYPRVLAGWRATDWGTVAITRVFRILPLVIVSLGLVTAIVMARTGIVPGASYPRAAMMWISAWDEVPLLGYPDSGRINAYVLWSLWYEWLFYLLLLPACALVMDAVRERGLPSWTVAVGLFGVALATRAAAWLSGAHPPVLQYLPLFAIGMIAYECQARPAFRSALSTPLATVIAVGALLVGMIAASFPYNAALPLFGFFFVCVACGNSLGGVLRTRGALVLGECSFGIYLLHGIVLDVQFVDAGALPASLPVAWLPALLPGLMLIVVAVTAATYAAIERPMIGRGRALARWVAGRRVRLDSRELEVAP